MKGLCRSAAFLLCLVLPAEAEAGPLVPGPFEGEFQSRVYRQKVGGDAASSFLSSGNFYQNDLDLSLKHVSRAGVSVTGQVDLQQSDDPLVEAGEGRYKALGGFLAVERSQKWRLEGGNIIPKASRATLTSSVLGFGGYVQVNQPGRLTRVTAIAGQLRPPVDGSRFRKGVVGGSLTQMFAGSPGSVKLMGNFFRVEDLRDSIAHREGLSRLGAAVGSLTADLKSRTGLSLSAEAAFLGGDAGQGDGRSFRVGPAFANELFSARAGYELTSPSFINPAASMSADTERADASMVVGKVHQLSFNGLYSHNNVEGQRAATTRTSLAGTSLKVVPVPSHEFWKGLSVVADCNINRSRASDGTLDVENRQMGFGPRFDAAGVRGELRGEHQPTRDFRDPSNDRDLYRGRWDMGVRLRSAGKLRIAPGWSLMVERTRSLATGLADQACGAGGSLGVSYGGFSTEARHEFQQTVTKPSGRKTRNESSFLDIKWEFMARAPVSIKLSFFRKHYGDTTRDAFSEEGVSGGVDVRL